MKYSLAVFFLSVCMVAGVRAADFRITDYGAPTDGSRSAVPALMLALEAAGGNSSSRVIFPPGTYLIDHTIKVAAGHHVHLVGEGMVTIKTGPNMEEMGGGYRRTTLSHRVRYRRLPYR